MLKRLLRCVVTSVLLLLPSCAIDLRALNARGSLPPMERKQGAQAFRVTLRKNKVGSSSSNAFVKMQPRGFFPADESRVTFRVWFDDDMDWEPSDWHRVGGKLGGFSMGTGDATGGVFSDSGASCRVTFGERRAAMAYLYPQTRRTLRHRYVTWRDLDQRESFVEHSYIATGVHVFSPKISPRPLRFLKGRWNDVELAVRLNRPGRYDGVLELVVNGNRKRLTEVRFRYDRDVRINGFVLNPFFGGSSRQYAPRTDITLWFADFEFTPL